MVPPTLNVCRISLRVPPSLGSIVIWVQKRGMTLLREACDFISGAHSASNLTGFRRRATTGVGRWWGPLGLAHAAYADGCDFAEQGSFSWRESKVPKLVIAGKDFLQAGLVAIGWNSLDGFLGRMSPCNHFTGSLASALAGLCQECATSASISR